MNIMYIGESVDLEPGEAVVYQAGPVSTQCH